MSICPKRLQTWMISILWNTFCTYSHVWGVQSHFCGLAPASEPFTYDRLTSHVTIEIHVNGEDKNLAQLHAMIASWYKLQSIMTGTVYGWCSVKVTSSQLQEGVKDSPPLPPLLLGKVENCLAQLPHRPPLSNQLGNNFLKLGGTIRRSRG